MRDRLTIFGAALALAGLIGGCGTPDQPAQHAASLAAPTAAPQPAALADQLYVRGDDGSAAGRLAILGGASGGAPRDLPLGAIAPDWSVVYTVATIAAYGPQKTVVQALDLKTGRPVREATIDGAYALPSVSLDGLPGGLSPNGRWLALRKAPGQPAGAGQFVVLDTAFERAPRQVNLDAAGIYEFDGLNNDGSALYLIEYLAPPKGQLAKYQVRYYNLALGALDPQVVVAKGEGQVMAGTHHTSLAAPDGIWRYSLYMNNDYGPFIHALNMNNQFAICVDLPKAGKNDEARQRYWSLAISPDGRRLYAVNGALGLVSELDISQEGFPQVSRTATLPPAPAASEARGAPAALLAAPAAEAKPEHGAALGAAAVSVDGATLFALGERGLLAIDARDLSLRGRYLPDLALGGLAIGASSGRLYAAGAETGQLLQIEATSGAVIGEAASAWPPRSILRATAWK